MKNRLIVMLWSDPHGGSELGLCNPETELQDEDEEGNISTVHPGLSKTQERLWKLHTANAEKLAIIADGYPVVSVLVGDASDGTKYQTQSMDTDQSNQIAICVANMEPITRFPNLVRIQLVHGTGAHAGVKGAWERQIAKDIKLMHPNIDVETCYHWTPTLNGVKLNVAHHGPGVNRRHWLKGGVVLQYLRSLVYQELWAGNEPPALSVFGHVHTPEYQFVDRGADRYAIDILPSMCGLSEFGRQVTQSTWQITWGWDVFVIENGKIGAPINLHETLDIRTREVINYG